MVTNYTTNARYVHLDVHYKPNNQNYAIISTYAPAQTLNKSPFWTHLTSYCRTLPHPWLLLMDLNEICSHNDKLGGRPLIQSQLHHLPLFFSKYHGHGYTNGSTSLLVEGGATLLHGF